MQPITIVALIALVAILVVGIMMGSGHVGNTVVFAGGAIVVVVARALGAGRSRRR